MNIIMDNNDDDDEYDYEMIIGIIIVIIIIVIVYVIYRYIYNNKKDCSETVDETTIRDTNIITQIYNNKKINPDMPAIYVMKDKIWISVNYEDYYNNAKQFALSLNHWLGDNINVLIIGNNSPATYYAYIGCIANNGAIVCLPGTYTKEDYAHIINDSDAQMIVAEDDEILEKIHDIEMKNVKLILYYTKISESTIDKFKIPLVSFGVFMDKIDINKKLSIKRWKKINAKYNENNTASIIYTQNADGVMITHRNINNMLLSLIETINSRKDITQYSVKYGCRIMNYQSMNNMITQFMDIIYPIYTMGVVYINNNINNNSKKIIKLMRDIKPTIFIGNNNIWNDIAKYSSDNHNKIFVPNYLIKNNILTDIGLEECMCFTYDAQPVNNTYFDTYGIDIYNIFGINESTGIFAISLPKYHRDKSVGIPIDGLRVKIHMDGEILIKGNILFAGYMNNKKKTKKIYDKKWLKTGYHGYMDKGYLFIAH